jgi:hypothetical protein
MLEKTAQRLLAARRRLRPGSPALAGPRSRRPAVHEPPPRVLFVNDLWGYGTVTMAMVVADALEGHATRLFAGMGPGLELARRSSFDGLLAADTTAEIAPDLDRGLDTCQAVVSVMNQRVARKAAQRGIPCVYVDCLLWMQAAPPDVPAGVHYFQERFPGAEERLARWRHRLHRPEIVGPLVTPAARRRSGYADAVLVNFGGLSASLFEPATLVTYADTMTRCVLDALRSWPGRVVVGAGRHVLDRMDRRTLVGLRPAVELVDLGHDAYLAELRRSHLLVTSAGVHALYEAFALGVPAVCLPAQNLSQVLALEALESGRVASALDWNRLYGLRDLDAADEAGASRRIAEQIGRFSRDPFARSRLTGHLRAGLDERRLTELRQRQARFYAEQGELGAPRIASRVLELLQERGPERLLEGA